MKRKKTLSKKDKEIENLKIITSKNIVAMTEPSKKLKLTQHNLKTIKPLTEPQKQMFQSFMNGYHIVADGSAGTGKTFSAIYLALNEFFRKETNYEKIIIVRSAVATRDIGFLPGNEMEKTEVFERPYADMFSEMIECNIGYKSGNIYQSMKEKGDIQFMPTSFIRGMNWDDCIVIVDELQNMNFHEINSILTRLGQNTKLILCGDYIQSDLNKSKNDSTGIKRFLRIIQNMDCFDYVRFTTNDIVRSDFVKSWIIALENDMEENGV
jgi:phosphate starvation-inducible PhoH-like protein